MEINLKKTLPGLNKLFNGRNNTIKFVDEQGSAILQAKGKVAEKEPKPEPEP